MRTCIITGTGAGIGREVAILLSRNKQFDCIAMLGRGKEALEETKCLMDSVGIDISIWMIDFQMPEDIPAIVEAIYEKYGSIDCLLNIAGYTDPQPLLQTTLENMEKTYKVNVFSPFLCISLRISIRVVSAIALPKPIRSTVFSSSSTSISLSIPNKSHP